ncbi:MAG: hypothetical protein E3J65_01260 [Dehalococcoidia bacterium]|nr:MAG: hypothetical protein E3J65_01260 [Dehalococcoidia bacterium]
MRRIFFDRYDSSGKFPDGRVKLDVYFKSSDGENYVWTPDWEKGTRHFFLEAYRIEKLNRPESPERERFKQVAKEVLDEEEPGKPMINFKFIAIQLGEGLKYQASVNEINRTASAIFDFDASSHPHSSITSIRSQTIYDWVMSLSEQPLSDERKLQLLKNFIDALTPENSPLRKLPKGEGTGGEVNG